MITRPSDVTPQIFVQIELLASDEYCEHRESASNEFGENNWLGLKNLFLLSERFEKIFLNNVTLVAACNSL